MLRTEMEDGKVSFLKAQELNFMPVISNDRLNDLSGIQNIKLTIYSVTILHYPLLLSANRFIRTTLCPAQKGLMWLFSLPGFIDTVQGKDH